MRNKISVFNDRSQVLIFNCVLVSIKSSPYLANGRKSFPSGIFLVLSFVFIS